MEPQRRAGMQVVRGTHGAAKGKRPDGQGRAATPSKLGHCSGEVMRRLPRHRCLSPPQGGQGAGLALREEEICHPAVPATAGPTHDAGRAG